MVQHLLTMQGYFEELDNWPPSESNERNRVILNYWEFAAENRKAQRQVCSGSSVGPADDSIVIVTRVVP